MKAIGVDPIQKALQGKQTWRQLKQLGNHVRFQFILPTELDQVIKQNGAKPVGHKSARVNVPKAPSVPESVALAPLKLLIYLILEGTFRCRGTVVQQIGPIISGVGLMAPR